MSAQDLLSSLEHVRQIRPGRWRAKCPSHDGKSDDSLSIAEAEDGTVLVRCWGGCSAAAIVEAAGLTLHDLFPRRDLPPEARRNYALRTERKQIRLALRHELWVLMQVNDAHIEGWPVEDPDPEQREYQAVQRVRNALEVLHGR